MSDRSGSHETKITVTSALPYANGEIHIGHIVSTYLPADIFTRYSRMKGYNVIHICATDDFGTPILIKAEQENNTPEEYVKYWHQRDLKDFTDLGISFDLFHQTSSNENINLAQHFFRKLFENNHIYNKKISQSYCEKDEKFLPDRYVVGACPFCKAVEQYSDGCEKCGRAFQPGEVLDPHCIICGNKPILRESLHYFFRLSGFSDQLKNWLLNNENLQSEVTNYVLNWIENGLKDWDITRDISWGVPIPLENAAGKVLYGWFDNHICYIASTLHYLYKKGVNGKDFWNSSRIYHFIGKDIVYHHYLFLTAMRMGIGEEYKLPDNIPVRGHLMIQNQKISKSRGRYLSLNDFLKAFPADYLRFYCSSITPLGQTDVNFGWADFQAKINNELVANVGNFVHRTLSFINTRYHGKVPKPGEYVDYDKQFIEKMKSISLDVGEKVETNHIDKAIKLIMDFSTRCNQYFQFKEPWTQKTEFSTCLYLCVNAVHTLSLMLAPYLPFSAEKLWKQLGLTGSVHSARWDSAVQLNLDPGHSVLEAEILFLKIEDEVIDSRSKELEQTSS